jgi:hypothetical protein
LPRCGCACNDGGVAIAVEVDQQAAALEVITRAVLRAIAAAGDQDALSPQSQPAVEAVLHALLADAGAQIPTEQRIGLLAPAFELVSEFLRAVIAEDA